MIAAMSGISFVPAFLTTATPIASARPVLNIAAPMTNMPPKSTTVEFESPAYTCLDGSTPRMPSAVQAAIAVTASGISSVTNRNAATASTHSVIIAGSIKTTFLIVILVFKECLPLFAAKSERLPLFAAKSIFQKSEKVHALNPSNSLSNWFKKLILQNADLDEPPHNSGIQPDCYPPFSTSRVPGRVRLEVRSPVKRLS